jgi:pyruvate/2-oxoglutarate/acetoin dehydrogenase E1 component
MSGGKLTVRLVLRTNLATRQVPARSTANRHHAHSWSVRCNAVVRKACRKTAIRDNNPCLLSLEDKLMCIRTAEVPEEEYLIRLVLRTSTRAQISPRWHVIDGAGG